MNTPSYKVASKTIKVADFFSKTAKYVPVGADQIPNGVRFDVTRRNQGQIVEVAYGGFGRAEHDHGDPFKRVTDASNRSVKHYAWTEA